MGKSLIKFLIIGEILIGSTVLSGNHVAKASTTLGAVQNYDREEMVNYLLGHSVPEEKIEILLKKLANDEPWDCYKEEKLKNVPSDFDSFELNDGEDQVKYYRFEDGSFLLNELRATESSTYEDKEIEVFERGVSNTSYGSQYTDYKISKTKGAITGSFIADFWRARSGCGASEITNVYRPRISGGTTDGSASVNIDRSREDLIYKAPAQATLSFALNVSISGIPVGVTQFISLKLMNGSMNIVWE